MKRRTRVAAASLLAVAGSWSVFALLVPGAASAQPPDVAAWWNAANVGNGAPAPPLPPDVTAGDLLVQGSNAAPAAPSTVPVGGAPSSSQAVAGLEFDLPPNAIVGALTLTVAGTAPPAENVVACLATRTFFAEDNGVWSDVPPSDCTQTVTSQMSGNTVTFAGIGKLVQDSMLRIVLLPGSVDRIVFAKPGDSALAVTAPTGVGLSAPPFGTGTNGGSSLTGGGVAQPPVAGSVGGAGIVPSLPTATGVVVPAPVVAPSPSATASTLAANPVAAASVGGLTTTQRRVLAAIVIGVEMLGFLLLMADRSAEQVAAISTAAATAGGRLRPPDRVGVASAGAPRVRGVGRFSGVRDGDAPRL